MSQNKPKKRTVTTKKSTRFTIELDIRALMLLLILVVLTALTVFYLGIIFGKASRDPNKLVTDQQLQKSEPMKRNDTISPKDLEIYNIKSENDRIDNLKENTKEVMEKADQVLQQTKKKDAETEKTAPAESESSKAAVTTKGESFVPTWPAKDEEANAGVKLFSIQVTATNDHQKASDIVRQLRKKGFESYLEDFTIEGKKIYRVRVSKKPRNELKDILVRLEKAVGGMGQKPFIVQIN